MNPTLPLADALNVDHLRDLEPHVDRRPHRHLGSLAFHRRPRPSHR